MTDTEVLTASLSIAAIAVSLLSLGYTLLWTARPFIRVEVNAVINNEAGANPEWRLTIANRGNAPAYDVRIAVVPGDGMDETEYVGSLDPDESFEGEFFISRFENLGDGSGTWATGEVDPSEHVAIIRWRTLPVLRIARKMKVRPGKRRIGGALVQRQDGAPGSVAVIKKVTDGAL